MANLNWIKTLKKYAGIYLICSNHSTSEQHKQLVYVLTIIEVFLYGARDC